MKTELGRSESGRAQFCFRARGRSLLLGLETRLMGIVNVTPDSFSDGGSHLSPSSAVDFALSLAEAGADILDIGGESTRPGSKPVSAEEECRRVIPVIESLRHKTDCLISVDTHKSEVAQTALESGADIINDISGFLFDEKLAGVVKRFGAGIVLMHCRGEPATMHQLPPSDDILKDVLEGLQNSLRVAKLAGIARDRIILDPGIGFGKNNSESLQILNRLDFLKDFELPILVGTSRKRFIGEILDAPVQKRLIGTIASSLAAILKGAHLLRVHDIKEVRDAAAVVDAISLERIP